jgi:site-specific recombinase XerD
LNRLTNEKGKSLKKITQNYHVIALRAFLKYLAKRDIKSLAAEKLELADAESRSLVFLEIDEIERLLAAPNQEENKILRARDKAILETLFSTGLRVSELVSLSKDHVNLKRGEFSVRGKGDKIRVVFLSDDARHTIEDYLNLRADNFKPLFIRHQKNNKSIEDLSGEKLRLTSRTIQRIIKKYSVIAGIVKKVTPHTIRHSFATDLLISGADIRSVQSMLGHSSITTTQIYTHITDQQLREVHKAFHGRRRRK